MRTFKFILLLALLVVVVGGVWVWWHHHSALTSVSSNNPVATVTFACEGNKSITASFYTGNPAPQPAPGGPPTPTGRVEVSLSDGRQLSLPQTISADGGRYSNGNPQVAGSETFVFWEKGNGAFVEEGANQQETYSGCVAVAPDPGGLSKVYSNGTAEFSFRYPLGYTLNTSYAYQELGPGKNISGVKVTIPSSMATGTNLSAYDTGVSVEQLSNVQDCSADLFLGNVTMSTSTITDGDTTFMKRMSMRFPAPVLVQRCVILFIQPAWVTTRRARSWNLIAMRLSLSSIKSAARLYSRNNGECLFQCAATGEITYVYGKKLARSSMRV